MRFLCILFLFSFISLPVVLTGQCPDKDSLQKIIVASGNTPPAAFAARLKQFLDYDRRMTGCYEGADSVYTDLLIRISTLYYLQGNFANAVLYARKNLQFLTAHGSNKAFRKNDIPKSFYFLSIFYDSLNMLSQKQHVVDSCIEFEKKNVADYKYTSFLLTFKVQDLFLKGDYNLCAEYAALGENIIRKYYHLSDSIDQIVYFITYRTNSLYSLGRFSEAEKFLLSSRDRFFTGENKWYQGIIFSLLGYVNKVKGDDEQAVRYFKTSFAFDRQTKAKNLSAEVLCQLGLLLTRKNSQSKQGLEFFHQALHYAKGPDVFNVLGDMAGYYFRNRQFDSAFKYYQQAFNSIKKGITESDLLQHLNEYVYANNVQSVLNVVLDKGDCYLAQYNASHDLNCVDNALKVYKVADQLLNAVKAEQTELESRLFWRTYTRRLYEHAVEACYLSNNITDAFYFFEKSRAVILNDQLNEQRWLKGDEFLKLAQAKKKILQKNREIGLADPAATGFAALQEEQYANKNELSRLEALIKSRYSMYYQGVIDSGFISLASCQKTLAGANQSILELFSGDSAVYTLLLYAGKAEFKKIDKHAFDTAVEMYTTYLADADLLNSHFIRFRQVANQLYQLLFAGMPAPAGRMIISPDLKYFPFESLVTDNTRAAPVYLLEKSAISYTYSARYLQNDFSAEKGLVAGDFMGVSPVGFSPYLNLAALNGSNTSLEVIGHYFATSKMLTINNATRNNFQQQFPGYKIVQLYTHAAEAGAQKEPVIYFNDSALYLSELIPERKPVTQLVVLSACETGKGALYQGEGVFSFNRSFAALGVPSSVTNLWSIDNVSTYKLTELFYKYLSRGLPLDIALQKAKLEYISKRTGENKLPYYWAAPILVGKTDAVIITQPFAWKYALVAAVLVLITWLGWKKLPKKQALTPAPDTIQTAP